MILNFLKALFSQRYKLLKKQQLPYKTKNTVKMKAG